MARDNRWHCMYHRCHGPTSVTDTPASSSSGPRRQRLLGAGTCDRCRASAVSARPSRPPPYAQRQFVTQLALCVSHRADTWPAPSRPQLLRWPGADAERGDIWRCRPTASWHSARGRPRHLLVDIVATTCLLRRHSLGDPCARSRHVRVQQPRWRRHCLCPTLGGWRHAAQSSRLDDRHDHQTTRSRGRWSNASARLSRLTT